MSDSSPEAAPGPLLGIETATPWGGAALVDADGRLRGHLWSHSRTGYSRRLMPTIDLLLREAGIAPRDLGGIAVSHGPGSFTGVRIGLVTARTLALELGVPLFTFSTLQALALRWPIVGEPVAVMLDARRGEVYSGVFRRRPGDRLEIIRAEAVESPADFVEALAGIESKILWMSGDAVEKTRAHWEARLGSRARSVTPPWGLPAADAVARMGARALRTGASSVDPLAALPVYLRASDAERDADRPAPADA
jgi:tRNA threonylcarbamoyladenosine biosynthesis protein TsaB